MRDTANIRGKRRKSKTPDVPEGDPFGVPPPSPAELRRQKAWDRYWAAFLGLAAGIAEAEQALKARALRYQADLKDEVAAKIGGIRGTDLDLHWSAWDPIRTAYREGDIPLCRKLAKAAIRKDRAERASWQTPKE